MLYVLAFLACISPAPAQQTNVVGPLPSAVGQASSPLAASLGGTGNTGGAFSTYTPTAACAQTTGTATCTATGRYQQTGKRVDLTLTISITGTFTAGLFTSVTLPVSLPAANVAGVWEFAGRENSITGITWTGGVVAAATTLVATNASNSAAIVTGSSLSFSGWYETQ